MDRYRSVSPTPDLPPVRGRRAAARSATAFLLATAAAVALGGVYVGGGNPQAEGALLSLAFLSLGVGLVTCAKHLLPQQPYAEKRDQLPTTEPERAAFARDFDRADTVTRRSALVRLLTLAAGAVGAALVIPLRSLGPRPSTSALHTNWRNGARAVTSEGTLVRADDVPLDGLVTVFPEHVSELIGFQRHPIVRRGRRQGSSPSPRCARTQAVPLACTNPTRTRCCARVINRRSTCSTTPSRSPARPPGPFHSCRW